MRWQVALVINALCVLIFMAVFTAAMRPQPASVALSVESKVPVGDGRWEQLKASLPQWLRENAQPDKRVFEVDVLSNYIETGEFFLARSEAEAWIKDLDAAEIVLRDETIHIGKWTYGPGPVGHWLYLIRHSSRTSAGGFVFEDVFYADGKWSYGKWGYRLIYEGRPPTSGLR